MPAGVSWGEYLKFMSCAMLTMMAGSQLVHMYYKPLQDIDSYIEHEMKVAQETLNTNKIIPEEATKRSSNIVKE